MHQIFVRSYWIAAAGWTVLLTAPLCAQWLDMPSKLTPHKPDGKVDFAAPVRRTADGKPDISGIWEVDSPKYFSNIAADIPKDQMPFQPWASAVYQHRRETLGKEDPQARCLPTGVPKIESAPNTPFRITQLSDQVLVLYERDNMFRQIYTDGRELPKDPQPSWMGYSIAKWEGDTLVVHATGFNDRTWLDDDGHPHTDAMQVTERFRRSDFGHLQIEITVDDPKAYTKPWTVKETLHILPDTELLEYICGENEKDVDHLFGK
jgi:hypothetical protein